MDKDELKELNETAARSKSNSKRIDELEEEVKENREITIAIKEIATEVKYLREGQTDMNKRLKAIEEKPIKEYEEAKSRIKWQIISFVLGTVLMFLAFKLGLKNYV